jgi:hypothetical protein
LLLPATWGADDGTETRVGPGDGYVIQPRHDAWVVGDEPWVTVDFLRPDQAAAPPAVTTTADHWLAGLYRKLASSVAWHDDTRLVVTWDEAANGERAGCCGGLAAGGQVATIITGPQVKAGRDDTPYSHYALLRSIETLLQLPLLGHASDPSTTTIPALS